MINRRSPRFGIGLGVGIALGFILGSILAARLGDDAVRSLADKMFRRREHVRFEVLLQ